MPVLSTIGAMAARGFGWLRNATGPSSGLFGWGSNVYGAIGDNTTTARSSPVQVGTLTTWSKVSAGNYHTLALKTDNTLWAWGYGASGVLGNSFTYSVSSPIQVGALTTWASVMAGAAAAIGLKTDGTLWGWGSTGQNGQSVDRSSPVQIGTSTSWTALSMQGYSNNYIIGALQGNSLYQWGANYSDFNGQSGSVWAPAGMTSGQLSPLAVAVGKSFASVAHGFGHGLGITTTGQLWAWGWNFFGECGVGTLNNPNYYTYSAQYGACGQDPSVPSNWDGNFRYASSQPLYLFYSYDPTYSTCDTTGSYITETYHALNTERWAFSSPVQVGSLTTWSKASCGQYCSLATKTDGTLWAWGYGGLGQLGNGTTSSYSSPVQVGAGTTWATVSCGNTHTMAVKTDGTLWAWGTNTDGSLGTGDTVSRSSPVQVGTATNWISSSLSTGFGFTHAVRS